MLALLENGCVGGRIARLIGLSGPWADFENTFVVEYRNDINGLTDRTLLHCGWRQRKWTKSCCMSGAEECELNEGPFGQAQQSMAVGGGPVHRDALSGKSVYYASKHRPIVRHQ